jgi:chromosome segregation ATPase
MKIALLVVMALGLAAYSGCENTDERIAKLTEHYEGKLDDLGAQITQLEDEKERDERTIEDMEEQAAIYEESVSQFIAAFGEVNDGIFDLQISLQNLGAAKSRISGNNWKEGVPMMLNEITEIESQAADLVSANEAASARRVTLMEVGIRLAEARDKKP